MDHFEEAMSDIAIRGAKNGGPTLQDVLIALQAQAQDADDTASILAAKVEEMASVLSESVFAHYKRNHDGIDRLSNDLALAVSERKADVSGLASELSAIHKIVDDRGARIEKAKKEVTAEHIDFHNKYIAEVAASKRKTDPDKTSFESKRRPLVMHSDSDIALNEEMRTSFKVGRYVLAALIVIAMTVAANYFVLYRGQQKSLNVVKENNATLSNLVAQQHQDTADLLILLHRGIDRQLKATPTPTPTATP